MLNLRVKFSKIEQVCILGKPMNIGKRKHTQRSSQSEKDGNNIFF